MKRFGNKGWERKPFHLCFFYSIYLHMSTELCYRFLQNSHSLQPFQIKFDEGIIGTPQLTDSIVLPEKFELFGQNIDLTPLKGIFSSIENAASSVARTISGQPPLKIPIRTDNAESWLLTTYLDDELRISRGDGSSIFVLFKEGSTLLY